MSEQTLNKKDFTEKQFYIINIKIKSDEEDKQNLYSSTFNQIFNIVNFSVKIGNKNGLVLKKFDTLPINKESLGVNLETLNYSNYEIILGEFVKYKIENENDKYYNILSKEIKSGDPNSIDKPNATEIPFYIIPVIHRLLLPTESKITPQQIKLFFEKALLKIYQSEEFFNIEIAKSITVIDEIYKFKKLNKLELLISYTNDDLGDDAKLFMDNLLKNSNINKYKGEYDADKNESLNLESNLIKGGIELSKENGELKATGINSYGNKVIINTKNHFEQLPLKLKNGINPLISILKESLIKWRK